MEHLLAVETVSKALKQMHCVGEHVNSSLTVRLVLERVSGTSQNTTNSEIFPHATIACFTITNNYIGVYSSLFEFLDALKEQLWHRSSFC